MSSYVQPPQPDQAFSLHSVIKVLLRRNSQHGAGLATPFLLSQLFFLCRPQAETFFWRTAIWGSSMGTWTSYSYSVPIPGGFLIGTFAQLSPLPLRWWKLPIHAWMGLEGYILPETGFKNQGTYLPCWWGSLPGQFPCPVLIKKGKMVQACEQGMCGLFPCVWSL